MNCSICCLKTCVTVYCHALIVHRFPRPQISFNHCVFIIKGFLHFVYHFTLITSWKCLGIHIHRKLKSLQNTAYTKQQDISINEISMRYMSFFIVSFCIQRFTCGFFNYCILFLIYILFIIFIHYYYNNISSLLSLHFNNAMWKCCNSSLFTFYLRSYSINRFPYLLLKPCVSSKTFL